MREIDRIWHTPPAVLALGRDEVHVWRAALDVPPSRAAVYEWTLAEDERGRAACFYFQRDRGRFVVARGLLRTILGHYLQVEPARLRFCYNPYGKPALAGECGADALRFNLAHSRGWALVAVTRGREIGVDVEGLRRDAEDLPQMAARFFSPRERAALQALPAQLQVEAFFACWTRKEAYLKARGDGLSFPLDRFDVSLAPGEPAALLSVEGDPGEVSRWSLCDLGDFGAGYAAALAVEGRGCDVGLMVY